jgi:hypothetical protein
LDNYHDKDIHFIKVFCTDYRILYERPKEDPWGEIDHAAGIIRVHPECKDMARRLTLWHEMIHAIEYHTGLDLGEQTIDILATGIVSILDENERLP